MRTLPEDFIGNSQMLIFPTFRARPFRKMLLFSHRLKTFSMYDPVTDDVIVNIGKNSILVTRCKECNSTIIFDDPVDIVYLYRLTEQSPLLYAKLALSENGLQDYVDAMNVFN